MRVLVLTLVTSIARTACHLTSSHLISSVKGPRSDTQRRDRRRLLNRVLISSCRRAACYLSIARQSVMKSSSCDFPLAALFQATSLDIRAPPSTLSSPAKGRDMSGSLPAIGPGDSLGVSSRDIHADGCWFWGRRLRFKPDLSSPVHPSSSFNLDTGRFSEIRQLLQRQE